MQNGLFQTMKITILALSILLLVISGFYFSILKSRADNRVIHCSSAFDSYVANDSLHAKFTLYLYRGKGNVQIVGDYISSDGIKKPVKSVTGVEYQTDGENYHVRFTGNRKSFISEEKEKRFFHLVPFSLSSENIDYIYQIQQTSENSYIIGQNGIPLISCKKTTGRQVMSQ